MNKINTIALMSCAVIALTAPSISFAAEDKMMMKPDAMMAKPAAMPMEKKNEMMEKTSSMNKTMMKNEMAYSSANFEKAQATEKPFLVAFHKKGCPICTSQKQALNKIYADPMYKDLEVLVVDYDHDTENLKKFNVGMQGTLILYKGKNELSRSSALVDTASIEAQIKG
jgi:hypothetical protein